MKKLIVIFVMGVYLQHANAQPGHLDSSFGTNGIVTAQFGGNIPNPSRGVKALVQTDGSTYILANTRGGVTFISKRHPDGSRDVSYGQNGFYIPVSIAVLDASLLSDGKILLAGSVTTSLTKDFALARVNTDGTLDSSFTGDGIQTTSFGNSNSGATSVAVQVDGKIVLAGSVGNSTHTDFAVARYNVDGSLDNTFDGDGKQTTHFDSFSSAGSITILEDGKIVAAGTALTEISKHHFAIARYNTDGSPDKTFYYEGSGITGVQKDGKIITVETETIYPPEGEFFENFVLNRYNTDGRLDNSFSQDGKQITGFGKELFHRPASVVIQNNGKIVLAGNLIEPVYDNISSIGIARFNPDGSLDNSFSDDGMQTIINGGVNSLYSANSVAVQSDGKITIVGSNFTFCKNDRDDCPSFFYAARFNSDGNLKTAYSDQLPSGGTSFINTAIQKDGKIITIGSNDFSVFVVARYNTDGNLDNTFSEDGIQVQNLFPEFIAYSVAIQPDQKIVVLGHAFKNKVTYIILFRFNTDGSLDNTFDGDGVLQTHFQENTANAVAIQ
ncbi:MAG: hypothetical protein ABIR81_06225, partial [Ginsengibacter sp.]